MTQFFNGRLCRLTTRMALIVLCLIGFLGCQSDPAIPDDVSGDKLMAKDVNVQAKAYSIDNIEDYQNKPLDYWDTIVEPINGDNRSHLREVFDDEKNHKILVREGTYPIDVLSKNSEDRTDRYNLMLKDRKDVLVYFEEGAKIKVKPNHYGTHSTKYSVIQIANSENIRVINPTIEGDKYTHKGKGGEWASGIKVTFNSRNVQIKGADIRKMWGDGFGVSQGVADSDVWPENIVFEDFKTIDNGRNGISVTCGKNITLRNGETSKNYRTAPAAGIDIERAGSYSPLDNIVVDGVKFRDNYIGLVSSDGTGAAVFKNLDIANGLTIRANAKDQTVKDSKIIRADSKNHPRISLYKTRHTVNFINNKVIDVRILAQKRRGDIIIKDNDYIVDKYNPGHLILLASVDDNEYVNSVIEDNNFYNAPQSTHHPYAAITVTTKGKVKILNNNIDFKRISGPGHGIGIGKEVEIAEIKNNTINIDRSSNVKFSIHGKIGNKYDLYGNIPELGQYTTNNLKRSLKVEVK